MIYPIYGPKRVFMKKLALIFVLSVLISACGVQRPYAPTISLLNGDTALPFATQSGITVQTYSLYNVRVDWNVSNTGAQGVKIIIANGEDYYCSTPIATKTIHITDSSTITNNSMDNLGYMFYDSLSVIVPGKTYAICVCSVLYNSISEPSLPVFVELMSNNAMGYYY